VRAYLLNVDLLKQGGALPGATVQIRDFIPGDIDGLRKSYAATKE
jgi:hypothetical protein